MILKKSNKNRSHFEILTSSTTNFCTN